MKCPKCINEVARLWKHPRIAAIGYPEGICTTCYVGEKESWGNSELNPTRTEPLIAIVEDSAERVEAEVAGAAPSPNRVAIESSYQIPGVSLNKEGKLEVAEKIAPDSTTGPGQFAPCRFCGAERKRAGKCRVCKIDARRKKNAAPEPAPILCCPRFPNCEHVDPPKQTPINGTTEPPKSRVRGKAVFADGRTMTRREPREPTSEELPEGDIVLTPNAVQWRIIRQMIVSGLHGNTKEEVCLRLLDAGLQRNDHCRV